MSAPTSNTLTQVTSGSQLYDLLAISTYYFTSFPDPKNDGDKLIVSSFFEIVETFGEGIPTNRSDERPMIEQQLDSMLSNLSLSGLALWGGKGPDQQVYNNGQSTEVPSVELVVK